MNEVLGLALILLLATAGYGAGRWHGQFGYRVGYRYGYRQGYFDGDRASWNRRRRDLQAAVASVLTTPTEFPLATTGTYASSPADDRVERIDAVAPDEADAAPRGRHARGVRVDVIPTRHA